MLSPQGALTILLIILAYPCHYYTQQCAGKHIRTSSRGQEEGEGLSVALDYFLGVNNLTMSSFNWPTCCRSGRVGKNCKETALTSYTNVSRCHIIDILNYIFLFWKTNIWNCFFISLLFLFLFLPHTLWALGGPGPCLFTALSSVIISMTSTEWAHSQFLLDEYMY